MCVLLAQKLQDRAAQNHHDESARRAQDANGLGKSRLRIIEEVQHLMDNHGIGAFFGKRQIVNVGEPTLQLERARLVKADAGASQHLAVRVHADRIAARALRQFKNAAGSGAKVQQSVP